MDSKDSEYNPDENTNIALKKGWGGGCGVDRNSFPVNKELQTLEATWYAGKGTGIRIRNESEFWLCRILAM